MQTIRNGSQGEAVKEWQRIIGVTDDGVFGPQTEAATKKWQAEHKLVADGVVGPLSWNAAGKKVDISSPAKSSSAPTDAWAYGIAKKADPAMPEYKRQYALTVARGEGFYGKGWGKQHPGMTEQDAQLAKTSNNWGAVQGTGPAGSFNHLDHDAAGNPYVYKYRRYNTPEEGFLDMSRILYGGGTRGKAGASELDAALRKGSLKTAVYAQRDNGYYELAKDQYLASVMRNYGQLTANLEWQDVLSETGHRLLDWMKWSFVGLATVGVGIFGAVKAGMLKI